jgi:hypothetical protein
VNSEIVLHFLGLLYNMCHVGMCDVDMRQAGSIRVHENWKNTGLSQNIGLVIYRSNCKTFMCLHETR